MKTSLLHDIEKWADKFALYIKGIRSTNLFIIIQINNYSINALEIEKLEVSIRHWFENAHWHSIDHTEEGLEIWIAL